MSLTLDGIQNIENRAVDAYCDEVSERKFDGETLDGTTYARVDVDRYREVPGTCYLPGDIIQDWLIGDFWSNINAFLRSEDCDSIFEYISRTEIVDDLTTADEYYDYVMSVCQDVEDYWQDYIYPELADNYFENNAEIDYNN